MYAFLLGEGPSAWHGTASRTYGVDAAFTSFQVHGWDIHAVSRGADAPWSGGDGAGGAAGGAGRCGVSARRFG